MKKSIILLILLPFFGISQTILPGSIDSEIARYAYILNPESDLLNSSIIYSKDSILEARNMLRKSGSFFLLNPQVQVSYNTKHPYGYNDGPVWQGKGATVQASAGVYGNIGNLHYTFNPLVYFSQNRSFELAPQLLTQISEFNYQFTVGGGIDYVQRYGSDPFMKISPAQSEIRYKAKHFSVALSTANFTMGPASINPIMMSNQGEGFPHLEIGITEFLPLSWKETELGKIKGSIYYGLLSESDYFDQDDENNQRYFTAFSLSYVIPYVDWLRVGVNRVLYQDSQFFEAADLVRSISSLSPGSLAITDSTSINDRFDQMASIFIEWTFPEAAFRGYMEFAKNDFNGSFRNLLVDTDHSRGFTIGFDKILNREKKPVVLTFEHTNLSRSISYQYRPEPPFYIHGIVRQGYTHNGQILGAGIGPGSSSNYLSFTFIRPESTLKLGAQRIQFNDDYFSQNFGFQIPPNFDNKDLRNSEYAIFSTYSKQKDLWLYSVDTRLSYRYNEFYQLENDKLNLAIGFTVRRLFN